jgi:hypothetical protein
MLFASGVAVGSMFSVTSSEWSWCHAARGANVHHALDLAFVSGFAVSVAICFVAGWRRLLLGALVLGAAVLSLELALVADDSATYTGNHCPPMFLFDVSSVPSVERAQVGYLYVLWGIALAIVLLQVGRLLRGERRSR